jgi:hypothetical protein
MRSNEILVIPVAPLRPRSEEALSGSGPMILMAGLRMISKLVAYWKPHTAVA